MGPDQAGHFVGPDLDPSCLTLMMPKFSDFFFGGGGGGENIYFEKIQQTQKKHAKLPNVQRVQIISGFQLKR